MTQARKARRTPNDDAGNTGGGAVRVILVDDHPMMRQALRETIAQHLPQLTYCGEAEDEATAIELVRAKQPQLAIIDLALKQGHGIDLVKRLREIAPSIRVLVFSMHEEKLYAERAIRAGALGYLNKQAPLNTIIEAITQVLAGQVYLSPQMADRILAQITGRRQQSTPYDIATLSDRELEALELIGEGKPTREVAELMKVSVKTIDAYRQRIKAKLGLSNSSELTRVAVEHVLRSSDGAT